MNDFAPGAAPPRGPQFDNRRVLAGVIDVLIVAVIGGAIGAVAGSWSPVLSAVVLGWGLFYYFAMESGAGQTVGKRLVGLRVTMADGSPADMRAIAMRTVLRLIDGIGLYVVGLIVMLVSGERRQRLGDMAGGTIITSADYVSTTQVASTAASAATVVVPTAPEAPARAASFVPPAIIEPAPVVEEPAPAALAPAAPAEAVEPAPAAFAPAAPAEDPAPAVEPVADAEPIVVVNPAPVEEEAVVVADPAPVEEEPVVIVEPSSALEPAPEVDFAPDVDATPAEQVKVRSVETISNIDLLMGGLEEDEAAGRTP